jgi:Zn-finger nucleic acid-binding protein
VIGESDGVRCPACHTGLEQVEAEVFRLECHTCHGIWLDKSGTEQVVRGAITVIDDEAQARQRDRARTPYRGQPRRLGGERSCPFCAAGLRMVVVPDLGVEVDVCSAHGTWFDVAELSKVVEYYVARRSDEEDTLSMLLRRARRPTKRARSWQPFW